RRQRIGEGACGGIPRCPPADRIEVNDVLAGKAEDDRVDDGGEALERLGRRGAEVGPFEEERAREGAVLVDDEDPAVDDEADTPREKLDEPRRRGRPPGLSKDPARQGRAQAEAAEGFQESHEATSRLPKAAASPSAGEAPHGRRRTRGRRATRRRRRRPARRPWRAR